VRTVRSMRARSLVLGMIFAILVANLCLPINAVHARVQDISITKLVDELHYRETFFVITSNENTYHIIVRANITEVGSETLIDLSATLLNPHNATIIASAAIPDTLLDHPFVGQVEAIHFHISEEYVENLVYLILPVVLIIAIVAQVYLILENIAVTALLTLLNMAPFVWASVPFVLLGMLINDSNKDDTGTHTWWPHPEDDLHLGSFDWYIPYLPLDYHWNLAWNGHYYVATSWNWWEIQKHNVYAPWPFNWLVLFSYFDLHWVRSRDETPPPKRRPIASFEWSPNQPIVGEDVVFTSTSFDPDGIIVTNHWWLGDGNEAATVNFTHIYTDVGNYSVTLEVTDNDGLTANVTQPVSIKPLEEARLRVFPDRLEIRVPNGQSRSTEFAASESLNQLDLLGVSFSASDFGNPDNHTISGGNVTFDMNQISITKGTYVNVTATFFAPLGLPIGWYNGNISVSSQNGGNASVFVALYIFGPPIANFTWDPPVPEVGEPVTFNASSSVPSGSPITKHYWDFGDGNVATSANPTFEYTYASYGSRNVTLIVEDAEGLNDTIWKIVHVLRHDVSVVDVAPDRTWTYQGYSVNINVTVGDLGDFDETVVVRLYYNITAGKQIGMQTVDLHSGENKTLMFLWDTTDAPYCHNYTITAVAEIVADFNMTDNMLESSVRVKVRILGDLNGDGYVGVDDIFDAGQYFGTEPGHPRWNVGADLNLDNYVGIDDIFTIASQFGQGCP